MKYQELSPEIVKAAVEGDTAALLELITVYQPNLLQFARQVCATPEDADDAVQETLWIISQRIGTLRMLTAFSSWAFRIVRNECYRLLRILRGDQPLDEEVGYHPDDPAAQRGLAEDVVTALASLAPKYRQVVIMRDIEEMTAPEVAAALGISVDAVKSRLHRARASLRSQLHQWVECE